MKRNQLKSLIKEIVKEVHGLTRQDRPGVMGAVNVEMTNPDGRYSDDMESGVMVKKLHDLNEMDWEKPEEMFYNDAAYWAKDNLGPGGVYKGEMLHNYGFPYKSGQKVPLDKGHLQLAMRNWNDAKKKRNQNLALGKPAGFDEQSSSGSAGAYSTPFAFKKTKVDEMTSTGAVAGYQTPFAFSKKKSGSQRAVDATKKLGYKVVGDTPRV